MPVLNLEIIHHRSVHKKWVHCRKFDVGFVWEVSQFTFQSFDISSNRKFRPAISYSLANTLHPEYWTTGDHVTPSLSDHWGQELSQGPEVGDQIYLNFKSFTSAHMYLCTRYTHRVENLICIITWIVLSSWCGWDSKKLEMWAIPALL